MFFYFVSSRERRWEVVFIVGDSSVGGKLDFNYSEVWIVFKLNCV